MKSVRTDKFKKAFEKLPASIQEKAQRAYEQWKTDSAHPSLHVKQVHQKRSIYSVRVGLSHRALGVHEEDTMIWFWIGSHEDYNNILTQL